MRATILAAIVGLTFQPALASPPATVVVGGKSLLGVPYSGPDGPPDEDLQRDWEDLLSQGGCAVPSQSFRTELDQKIWCSESADS